jgi:hypothetical protein
MILNIFSSIEVIEQSRKIKKKSREIDYQKYYLKILFFKIQLSPDPLYICPYFYGLYEAWLHSVLGLLIEFWEHEPISNRTGQVMFESIQISLVLFKRIKSS